MFSFFLVLIIIWSGLLAEIRWSVYQSPIGVYVCRFLGQIAGCTYTMGCTYTIFSFCANLMHSLIMWLIVFSRSPHSLNLLFCYVLSILALISLVLMASFCAALRRDSVSRQKFLFSLPNPGLSCEVLVIIFSSHFCFRIIVILLSIVLSVSFLMAVISSPSRFSM